MPRLDVVAAWTFFTNHGHVLLCIARDPEIRVRDLAVRIGITERAAQRIVADLVEAGYLERSRDGRRNRYRVRDELPLRHPVEQPHRVGEILAVLAALEAPRSEAEPDDRSEGDPDDRSGGDPHYVPG
jgi:DNA-binding transcriptional ArsR family regulator